MRFGLCELFLCGVDLRLLNFVLLSLLSKLLAGLLKLGLSSPCSLLLGHEVFARLVQICFHFLVFLCVLKLFLLELINLRREFFVLLLSLLELISRYSGILEILQKKNGESEGKSGNISGAFLGLLILL